MTASSRLETWPTLTLDAWSETYATLHMWTQTVGKVRLAQSPWMNHSWHVTLYVTARGLTTSPVPYGSGTFQIDFDFVDHYLTVQSSDGRTGCIVLEPQSVAAFYANLMEEMRKLDLHVNIYPKPNEVPEPIRFDQDETHQASRPGDPRSVLARDGDLVGPGRSSTANPAFVALLAGR